MPEYGAHAFLWIGAWDRDAGDRAIRSAAETGFDFIEIPVLDPGGFDAAAHRATLDDAGIGATVSLILPEDAHMPEHPERAKRFLAEVLDAAETLGAGTVAGCIGYHLGAFTGDPPTTEERATVAAALADVADDAAARGIRLAFEVCNRYETYLYNTLADGQDAVHAIGRDNVVLHADTYHMNIEEEGFHRPLVESADTLGYIHMSESHRGLVGSGTVIWDDVFRGLADAGYEGPLVLESFAAINPDLQAATKLWRPPNQPPGALAEKGLAFLKVGARKAGLS
jgi:D-psicose/D-tagatose/L-ribulose 3-epimerase